MAEESPSGSDPDFEQQDDVLSKIDQLLNRHRPKPFDVIAQSAPVLTDTPQIESPVSDDRGIPTLTDVVGPAKRPAATSRPGSLASVLILRRMAIALDAEHIRLLKQIDRTDAAQARMLDHLMAELKRALPGAVRAALADTSSNSRSEDEGRL